MLCFSSFVVFFSILIILSMQAGAKSRLSWKFTCKTLIQHPSTINHHHHHRRLHLNMMILNICYRIPIAGNPFGYEQFNKFASDATSFIWPLLVTQMARSFSINYNSFSLLLHYSSGIWCFPGYRWTSELSKYPAFEIKVVYLYIFCFQERSSNLNIHWNASNWPSFPENKNLAYVMEVDDTQSLRWFIYWIYGYSRLRLSLCNEP